MKIPIEILGFIPIKMVGFSSQRTVSLQGGYSPLVSLRLLPSTYRFLSLTRCGPYLAQLECRSLYPPERNEHQIMAPENGCSLENTFSFP